MPPFPSLPQSCEKAQPLPVHREWAGASDSTGAPARMCVLSTSSLPVTSGLQTPMDSLKKSSRMLCLPIHRLFAPDLLLYGHRFLHGAEGIGLPDSPQHWIYHLPWYILEEQATKALAHISHSLMPLEPGFKRRPKPDELNTFQHLQQKEWNNIVWDVARHHTAGL